MSNHSYYNQFRTLEDQPVILMGQLVIGATGAVTSFDVVGVGVVTRVSTGIYRFEFQKLGEIQSYRKLLYANAQIVRSGDVAIAAHIESEDVAGTVPQVVVSFRNRSGTATDPTSADVVLVQFWLRDMQTNEPIVS